MSAGSGRPFITSAPRSLPRYLSKSSFDLTVTTIGVPVRGAAVAGDMSSPGGLVVVGLVVVGFVVVEAERVCAWRAEVLGCVVAGWVVRRRQNRRVHLPETGGYAVAHRVELARRRAQPLALVDQELLELVDIADEELTRATSDWTCSRPRGAPPPRPCGRRPGPPRAAWPTSRGWSRGSPLTRRATRARVARLRPVASAIVASAVRCASTSVREIVSASPTEHARCRPTRGALALSSALPRADCSAVTSCRRATAARACASSPLPAVATPRVPLRPARGMPPLRRGRSPCGRCGRGRRDLARCQIHRRPQPSCRSRRSRKRAS